jgi:hypothetical protein
MSTPQFANSNDEMLQLYVMEYGESQQTALSAVILWKATVKAWSERRKYQHQGLAGKRRIANDLQASNALSAQILCECLLEARTNGAFHLQSTQAITYDEYPDTIERILDYIAILDSKGARSTHIAWQLIEQNVILGMEEGKQWRGHNITKAVNEIEPLSVVDNVKRLFERCTDDLENTAVIAIMEKFQRQGLRALLDYGARQRELFIQLEPVINRTRAAISLLENDTAVVTAKQRITAIYTCILNEVERERQLPEQPPEMAVSDSPPNPSQFFFSPEQPDEIPVDPLSSASLLAKLQTYAV